MPELRPTRFPPRIAGLALAAFAAAGSGCHAAKQLKDASYDGVRSLITSSYHDPDPDGKMAEAETLFEQQKYKDAEAIFDKLADNTYNPVLLAERARFMQAECQRLRGEGFKSVATYNRMLQDFPAGAYREKGCSQMYDIAYGWLKESTLEKVEREKNLEEGKMNGTAKPWYETAINLPNFTDKNKPVLDWEGEAVKYLEAVHTHDMLGPTADRALFWCGYVNFYRGRYEEADHFFSQIVELHKDSPLWKEAMRLAVIAKNNSTGGAVYDAQKASEALQLVNQVEATVPEYVRDPEKSSWLLRQKMNVRLQLAEKDYQMARYYERTRHPASAYFYYELVTRRYAGTKYAELAKERLEALKEVRAKIEADRAAGKPASMSAAIKQEWNKLTGPEPDPTKDAEPTPTGPTDLPKNTIQQVDSMANPR